MNFKQMTKAAVRLIGDNSPGILTGLGAAGAISTAVLAAKAGYRTSEILAAQTEDLEPKDKVELVWKEYIPAAISGVVTVSCVIAGNRVGAQRAAALTAAFKLSEQMTDEYKKKVVEVLGAKAEEKVRNQVAVDRMTANPPSGNIVMMVSGTEVLCYDDYSGRYVLIELEKIKAAVNTINKQILDESYASLSDFYRLINMDPTGVSDHIGWNLDRLLEVEFMPILLNDKPAVSFIYNYAPIDRFSRLHY